MIYTCTKDKPYDRKYAASLTGKWEHPDAEEVSQSDGYPGGDIVTYRCPNCGLVFKQELPQ